MPGELLLLGPCLSDNSDHICVSLIPKQLNRSLFLTNLRTTNHIKSPPHTPSSANSGVCCATVVIIFERISVTTCTSFDLVSHTIYYPKLTTFLNNMSMAIYCGIVLSPY